MTTNAVEEVKCTGCGKVIDPDWCHCGEAIAPNIVHDNHHPIPAGCDCFRTGTDADYGGDGLGIDRSNL